MRRRTLNKIYQKDDNEFFSIIRWRVHWLSFFKRRDNQFKQIKIWNKIDWIITPVDKDSSDFSMSNSIWIFNNKKQLWWIPKDMIYLPSNPSDWEKEDYKIQDVDFLHKVHNSMNKRNWKVLYLLVTNIFRSNDWIIRTIEFKFFFK